MTEMDLFRGALLGEACGDALGYPLQKLSVARIQRKFGPFGLRTLVRDARVGRLAPASAVTQLMLATVDGLLWADAKKLDEPEGVYRGYMRWFYSQTGLEPRRGQRTWMRRQPHEKEFCLVREKFMHERRNPEDGLVAAFDNEIRGSVKTKINDSKGASVITRAVPIGLRNSGNWKTAFDDGVTVAAFSHSNPVAWAASGAAAALISCLADGTSLPKSLEVVYGLLDKTKKANSVSVLLRAAERQANDQPAGLTSIWDHVDSIHSLGTGENADEALAIAVYAALALDDPADAVIVAANHDGASANTAAMTGAIEGVRFGTKFLPAYWTDILEVKDITLAMADKLYHLYEKRLIRGPRKK